jgi:hypothetical protein
VRKKTVRPKFKLGDLVTGKDRSYRRSIYKMVGLSTDPEQGMFEFQSLGNQVVDAFKNQGSPTTMYIFLRRYDEFRHATDEEIRSSDKVRAKYRLIYLLGSLKLADPGMFGFNKI